MTITGLYKSDSNFITVYSDNRIYTIAKNSDEWGCVAVGEQTASGHILSQEIYDKWKSSCNKTGIFVLKEDE